MKERPILFSAPMVRALLAGTKTQTRRIVKPQPPANACYWKEVSAGQWLSRDYGQQWKCPYGVAGDRLWVKETWAAQNLKLRTVKPSEIPEDSRINYAAGHCADDLDGLGPWRPSLFMMRWMSRITLEIVSVRVERLHEITEADAKAEGVTIQSDAAVAARIAKQYDNGIPEDRQLNEAWSPSTMEYWALWEKINGAASWALNPWVWVVEFRRVEA
jgi:hypothetical protein